MNTVQALVPALLTTVSPTGTDSPHVVNPFVNPAFLVIFCRPKEYFLHAFKGDGTPGGDTFHTSLGEAFAHAHQAFGPKLDGWRELVDEGLDAVEFGRKLCSGPMQDGQSSPKGIEKKYFRGPGEGKWGECTAWMEFHGEIPVRQVEKYSTRWVTSRYEDWETGMTLCDLGLSELDLTNCQLISYDDFELVWLESDTE